MRIKLKSRRGSILVMVALMLGTFMAIAAIAADIGRFYVVTGELQTTADAAALRGAKALQLATANFEATVEGAVIPWAQTVGTQSDGQPVVLAADSIDVGFWTPGANGAPGNYSTTLATGVRPNAVRVKAAGQPKGVFAQLIGRATGLPLSRQAIAWIGNVSLNCTRPWALQYRPLVEDVNGDSDTTKALDMTKFLAYQDQPADTRVLIMHNEQSVDYTSIVQPPDDGVWNAYNLPSGPNGGANSGQTTYESQIVNCNNIAMNSDAGNGNLQPSQGAGPCSAGTIVCWAMGVIEGSTSGPADNRGPGICELNPGDATCYSKTDGTAGVVIDIAYANKVGNGAGAIDFKYVGETTLLCFFKDPGDVCNAIPGTKPKTGYIPGTLVVVAQGLKSRTLNPTDIVSNAPSNVQRFFLVR
jgi:Flp pilus assembly protein TadG